MQPLLLLKQTVEAPFDPGALLLDGPNVSLTAADQLLSRSATRGSAARTFTVEVTIGDGSFELTFGREERVGIAIKEMAITDNHGRHTLRPGMTSNAIRGDLPDQYRMFDQAIVSQQSDLEWRVTRSRCFLTLDVVQTGGRASVFANSAFSPDYEERIQGIIHVPGLRGNPDRTYKTTAVGKNFPGTFEAYVASLILYWQSTQDERLQALRDELHELGLTWKVEAKPVDDTRVELRVGRLPNAQQGGARDLVSIADVGFGVSQTLPLVVALLTASSGQVVYVEQPEIHLHPRAQARLAKLFARAASRGVIVIVETHSSLLVRAIQTLVAKEELDQRLVALHWFTRRATTGATVVKSAELDPAGAFGDWPIDFDDVTIQSEREYLDAAERRLLDC